MSLDNAIAHGKEKRKPYRGRKSVDVSCRSHGGCPDCKNIRKYKNERRKPLMQDFG